MIFLISQAYGCIKDNGVIFNFYCPFLFLFQFTPHPHAGDKWCIYPSYDYAHCIVDSLENITHSVSSPPSIGILLGCTE